MRRTLQQSTLFYGALLAIVGMATIGCEPQFEDGVCEVDGDCFPDESCIGNQCVITGMPADVGPDVELNECGGTEVLDDELGDRCGPCDLDEYECSDDGNALECNGNTECPELDIITTNATDIGATTATLHGVIDSFPHEDDLEELGFCWAHEQGPTLDDDCVALSSAPTQTGDFSLEVDGLQPGTEHFVRAYSIFESGHQELANEVDFITDAPAPTIDTESSTDAVLLSWQELEGATHYEIYAGDDLLVEIEEPDTTTYEDSSAPAGTVSAPLNSRASDNRTDGIRLTWNAAQNVDGADVEYTMIAFYRDAESQPSDAVDGNRSGYEPTGYQLYAGTDDPTEADWSHVGGANALEFVDEQAPLGSATAGTATATKGEHSSYVRVVLDGATVSTPASQSYRLRATYGEDDAFTGNATSSFSGNRGVGSISYQWYRTTGTDDEAQDYIALDGATGAQHNDTTAPGPGEIRYYHVQVSAPGADSDTSNSDYGFVSGPGAVDDLDINDVEATSALLSAQITSLGAPAADEHGFCYSTESEPSYPDDCVQLGMPDLADPDMSDSIEDLEPATLYHVRAFIDSESGTAYSEEATFTTLADAPQGLEASKDDAELVTVSWTAVDGAVGYEISIDDGPWIDISAITYEDEDAPAPTIDLDEPTATDHINGVDLALNPIVVNAGDDVDYRVRAVDGEDRRSVYSEATGNRDAGEVVASWEFRDDSAEPFEHLVDINDPEAPGHFDDTITEIETTRYYQVTATVEGLEETKVTSATVEGQRLDPEE